VGGKRRVSNNQKKRRILARRESDLLRALQRGQSEEKVASAAEEVRAARIRVLNVKRSLVPPFDGPHVAQLDRIDDEIREYREAARLDPRSADASFALGKLLSRLGRFDEASERFASAFGRS
jgi:tetratricopeptide (TPR) repeat protein